MTSSFPRRLAAWLGVRVAIRKKVRWQSIATHGSGGLSPFRGHRSALYACGQFTRAGAFDKREVRESRLSRLPHRRRESASPRLTLSPPDTGGRWLTVGSPWAPATKSSNGVQSPRIDYYLSPSLNSAVGFFLKSRHLTFVVEGSNRGACERVILYRVDATPITCGTSLSSNSPRVNDFRQTLGYNGPD